jgi:hypothetical protein
VNITLPDVETRLDGTNLRLDRLEQLLERIADALAPVTSVEGDTA